MLKNNTERTFVSYAVVPDRSSRRGWLCWVTDSLGITSSSHHARKTLAIAWGEGLVHG